MVNKLHDTRCNLYCCLNTFGIFLMAFGISFAIFWPQIFENILNNEMKLKPGSVSFTQWQKPKIDLFMDIYLFNWTNPESFLDHSTKPILQELGPYRFREQPEKIDITWNNENSTISYRSKSMFHFDPEGSKGSLDDVLTTVNIVAVSAATKARHWNFVQKKAVSVGLTIYNQEVHVTKTARELLFEGYEDDMVTLAKDMPLLDTGDIPFDRVGWFYMRNNSGLLTGYYNVDTGMINFPSLGSIKNWNYDSRTDFFADKCGELSGSAGEFYSPHQTREKPVAFFTPDMCRTLNFDYEEDVNINGLKAFKYSAGAKTFDNGSIYEENECFCSGDCMPSGVLNISSCRFGTPVFMSLPHYFNADSFYPDQVEGMNPQKEKHQFYLALEPTTGIPVDVAARFQVNVLLRPVSDIFGFDHIPETYIPVLWFEQRVTADQKMADQINLALTIPCAGRIMGIVLACVGLLIIIYSPFSNFIKRQYFIRGDINENHPENPKKEITPLLVIQNSVKIVPSEQQIIKDSST